MIDLEPAHRAIDVITNTMKEALQLSAENESLKKELNEKDLLIKQNEKELREKDMIIKQNEEEIVKLKRLNMKAKSKLKQMDKREKKNYIGKNSNHNHSKMIDGKRHTSSEENHTTSSPQHQHEISLSLLPSSPNASPPCCNSAELVVISDDSSLSQLSQGLLGAMAVSRGRRPLQLVSSPSKKSRVRYLEARPVQEGEGQDNKHTGCDHTSKPSGGVHGTQDPLSVTCLPTGAHDPATKAARSCDQTCDVTCLPCDMPDDSDALPVINLKDGHVDPEVTSPSSSSDLLSPSLFTFKQPDFPLTTPPPLCSKMSSTFIVQPVGVMPSCTGLAMSPIRYVPQVEGIPLSDSQLSLDTSETQPPSPKIDSSRCHNLLPPVQGSHNLLPPAQGSHNTLPPALGSHNPLPPVKGSCVEHPNTTGLSPGHPPPFDVQRREERRRRRRRRGLKQTTLTQVLPDGSLGLATPTIVPVTPGIRPIMSILSDPASGLFLRPGDQEYPERPGDQEEAKPSKRQCGSSKGEGSEDEWLHEHEGEESLEEDGEEEAEHTLVESEEEKEEVLPYEYAKEIAKKAGLPTYKFVVPIRKKSDRDKLDAKPCPDCEKWFADGGGIHRDPREHRKQVCRHKHLYLPPDTDPRIWDISFPNTEECERIMGNRS